MGEKRSLARPLVLYIQRQGLVKLLPLYHCDVLHGSGAADRLVFAKFASARPDQVPDQLDAASLENNRALRNYHDLPDAGPVYRRGGSLCYAHRDHQEHGIVAGNIRSFDQRQAGREQVRGYSGERKGEGGLINY